MIWKYHMEQLNLIKPDIYELNTKINWLKHFFLIKRSFSVKIGNNLKILFDLVINIIDSDDFV